MGLYKTESEKLLEQRAKSREFLTGHIDKTSVEKYVIKPKSSSTDSGNFIATLLKAIGILEFIGCFICAMIYCSNTYSFSMFIMILWIVVGVILCGIFCGFGEIINLLQLIKEQNYSVRIVDSNNEGKAQESQ